MVQQGLSPLESLYLPRIHAQLLPDEVACEEWSTLGSAFEVPPSTLQALSRRGQTVVPTTWAAIGSALVIDSVTGAFVGASDPRKDGAAAAL